jgi:hypothetical protein
MESKPPMTHRLKFQPLHRTKVFEIHRTLKDIDDRTKSTSM